MYTILQCELADLTLAPIAAVERGAVLGTGGFGIVYRAELQGRSVALKVSSNGYRAFLRQEFKILRHLTPHPHIVQPYALLETESEETILVLEYLAGQELFAYDHLTVPEVTSYARQLVAALEHCHTHGVTYHDLKPENIMIEAITHRVILVDFGFSALGLEQLTTCCGTLEYCAAEMWEQFFDYRIDLWSLGVVLYEMLEGEVPFSINGVSDLLNLVPQQLKHLSFESVGSEELQQVIRGLLQWNPQNRIKLSEIVLS